MGEEQLMEGRFMGERPTEEYLMIREIRLKLHTLAETDYKKFNEKLLPGVDHILGIRLPALRRLAKEIAKSDYRKFLDEAADEITADSAHEEILLEGLVIGYAKMEDGEYMHYLDAFIPKIQNWAACDSSCMGYKFMEKRPQVWFPYLERYWKSDAEFEIRFAVVSMLVHYIDEEHIDEILRIFNGIHHDGYYVKMAVAWAVSVCYVKFPEKTRAFLLNNELDDFTHNKSIQKIRESYRVSKAEKEELKGWKR